MTFKGIILSDANPAVAEAISQLETEIAGKFGEKTAEAIILAVVTRRNLVALDAASRVGERADVRSVIGPLTNAMRDFAVRGITHALIADILGNASRFKDDIAKHEGDALAYVESLGEELIECIKNAEAAFEAIKALGVASAKAADKKDMN
jgi:hypothetical protein